MLGLLLIYWVGKAFYQLAESNQKSPWGFAFAGIGMYYGVQILLGLAVGIYLEISGIYDYDLFGLNLVGIGVGALTTYLFYQQLKKQWSREKIKSSNPDILDDLV